MPLSIRVLASLDTPHITYPGHDFSWHAATYVSGTWHSPTRHVSWHITFWSRTRRVSRNFTAT